MRVCTSGYAHTSKISKVYVFGIFNYSIHSKCVRVHSCVCEQACVRVRVRVCIHFFCSFFSPPCIHTYAGGIGRETLRGADRAPLCVSICTFVLVKQVNWVVKWESPRQPLDLPRHPPCRNRGTAQTACTLQRQYLHFCTSKASTLVRVEIAERHKLHARCSVSICTFVLVKQVH